MASTGMSMLVHVDVDLGSPVCQYPIWVRLIEVAAQVAVLCPACRRRIWLRDDTGSVQHAPAAIDHAVNEALADLTRAFKGMY